MIKNYALVFIVGFLLVALLLLIAYPKDWLKTVIDWAFADQAIIVFFAIVCSGLAVALLVYPILDYLKTGQTRRIEIIKGFFTAELIVEYLRQFWMGRNGVSDLVRGPVTTTPARPQVLSKFNELMESDFGLGRYRFPLGVLIAVAGIVMFFAFTGGLSLAAKWAKAGETPILEPPLGITVDLVSVAAIFGAYIWVTSDAIGRNHHGAFHASDLSWYALRLIIAVPLGQVVSMAAGTDENSDSLGEGWAAFAAFVISMFSLERIYQILGSIANRTLKLEAVSPAERDDLIIRLPGVDERSANLLGAEGVTTISHVVAADPVRLSIRTALPFDYILDLIDAGLLWRYVRDKLGTFREFGFKGVSSVLAYCDDAHHSAQSDAIIQRWVDAKAAVVAAEGSDRAAQDALAALQSPDATTQAAADQAAEDLKNARERLTQAEAALHSSMLDEQQLMQDLAKKAEMEVSGVARIFTEIDRDSYARFIRRLMG